jgi:uncharacterized membrane-anchored protein YjiN (DUF445 family)
MASGPATADVVEAARTASGRGGDLSAADLARRRDLRRMKAVSGGLLALAAVCYFLAERAARSQGSDVAGWVLYVRAAAVAGMVGGLADWFAVTALFRHPLGLPIPHTAIIPTRKDAIGRNLGEFVGTHFLAADVVRDRVMRARPAARAGAWLAVPANAERVSGELAGAFRAAVGLLRDDDVQAVLDQLVTRRLAAVPAGPALGRLLGGVVQDGSHRPLVDLSLVNAHRWLVENRQTVLDAVIRQAPTWTPRFVDERVAERVYAEVLRVVGEVRDEPDHAVRASLDRFLAAYAQDLQHDAATQERAEQAKVALLNHPDVRAAVAELGASVRRVAMEAAEDPEGELRRRTRAALVDLGVRLASDADLQAKVDRWAADLASHVGSTYSDELTTLITETVDRWDGPQTARRIELQVGRDLQFIRINGTVVGACAGIVIEALTHVVG